MIAKVLVDAGLDPTVVVGGLLKDYSKNPKTGEGSNFIAGQSKYFVIEACEYRRSFLNYNPQIIVITNIDNDHLDYYKDMADIVSAFKEFVAKVPSTGSIVCNTNLPYIKEAVAGSSADIVDFSDEPEVWKKLLVPGKHNVANAKATEAVAKILDIKSEVIAKSLGTFSGTWRRFEYKGKTESGAIVYDDYGHHPTEVRATLQGTREMFPDKKIMSLLTVE
jgi:UDP-N-acetylmuramate--alanine ligase